MTWGQARRPKVSNKLGYPNPREGSDGDIQVLQTVLGAKLFGKIGGRWYDSPLGIGGKVKFGTSISNYLSIDNDSVDIFSNNIKVASFGETTTVGNLNSSSGGDITVDNISLNGYITIPDADTSGVGTGNVVMGADIIGTDHADIEENVFIGYEVAKALTSDGGSHSSKQNVVIGYQALLVANTATTSANITGNVIIGQNAAASRAGGSSNTYVGGGAGYGSGSSTGDENVAVGLLAGQNTANASNTVAIGTNVNVSGNNAICIGTTLTAAADTMVIGRTGTGNYWSIDFTSSTTWAHSSDLRAKRNIQDDTLGLSFINDLKTKTFQWKPSEEFPGEWEDYTIDKDDNKVYPEMNDKVMHGMIAQDVKVALDNAGVDTFSAWSEDEKGIQQLAPASFVYPLIKAVQELSAKVDTMQTQINNLT